MAKIENKESCCGCGACMAICPVGAIHMIMDREGFCYPKINRTECIKCGKCIETCPFKNQKRFEGVKLFLGTKVKDEQIRYTSSSGGIFSILAGYVLRRQGIVYGAGYDGDMNVVHKGVENQEQLEQIKRTKYVQSSMEGIYNSIEENLLRNRWVLFCGTPCQAQALMLFLNKAYEKLIVVDLVCYGVPSPSIWRKYIQYLEHKHRGKVTDFSFRDKRNADNGHQRSYKIDGREYVDSVYRDIYCKMYFQNYILRPSCHKCMFCTVNRGSDFTIGDFWGIEHVRPKFDDGMGSSLVIAHSDKAKKVWNEIKDETIWFECSKKDSLQLRLLEPARMARRRWLFRVLSGIMPFRVLAKLVENGFVF